MDGRYFKEASVPKTQGCGKYQEVFPVTLVKYIVGPRISPIQVVKKIQIAADLPVTLHDKPRRP